MVDLVLVQFVEERVPRDHRNNVHARYLEIGHARYRKGVVVCSEVVNGVVKRELGSPARKETSRDARGQTR